MNNLLPTIKPTITHRADDKILSWRPDDAHPKTGKVSLFLESVFTKETTIKIIYGQNVLPSLPPNEKHVEKSMFPSDESPLKAALSEVADRPRLVFVPPPSLTRKTIIKDMSNGNCLMMKMINTLPICMDLFVQKKLAISTSTVCPMRQCVRLIAGTEDEEQKEDQACFWFCSSKRAIMTSTNRQELRDFTFSTNSQIGLEVEAMDEKLVVTKVLPDSQAMRYELQLSGADVIAVNGQRVINMNEFREAMIQAKIAKTDVVLKVASYKGGKGKLDTLYSHDFSKSKEVKYLLSNIMMHGLDSEHQRGLLSGDNSVKEADDEDTASEEGTHADAPDQNKIQIDGWENLEEYPDVEVIGEIDREVEEEEGMRARKRLPTRDENDTNGAPAPGDIEAADHNEDDAASAASTASAGSGDSWNHLTKVEEIVSRRSIVCFPSDINNAPAWGNPERCMQVSNYSSQWHLEVAWINEDNILIRKGDVPPGNTDYQLVDVGHVWCVVARPVVRDHGHHHVAVSYLSDGEALGFGIAAASEEGSPAMLTVKPSRYSLSTNKCTSVLWSPFVSMSVTHRLYLASKEEASTVLPAGKFNPPHYSATPHMHIQIFDGVKKAGEAVGGARPSSGQDVPLERIKLSKWPRKGNAKREKALRARK